MVRLAVRERKVDPPLDREKLWREGDKGPVLAITGNLGYFVNADAVTWWLRDVWPQLRHVRPDVRLVVAGDRPSPALRRAVETAGARLIESPPRPALGHRPGDARRSRRCAAARACRSRCWRPGRWGCRCVATSWAVAGTSGRQGEDFILVGQHPVEWVTAITDLLENPSARRWLIENGRRRLAADYSRETVRRQVLDVIRAVAPAPAVSEVTVPDRAARPA